MNTILTRLPTPSFWYEEKRRGWRGALPVLLQPFGCLYALAVRQRFDMHFPVPMAQPVICVGNAVAGGAGKTPVVAALVKALQARGMNPHILSRGYGGCEEGPLQISPDRDMAEDVGDEPLLLVEAAPTWVSRNRAQGVQAAIDTGASVVVMDDGLQNPTFYKDVAVLVLDGQVGLGNGRVMPAGPLREHFADALSRADMVFIVGTDRAGLGSRIAALQPDKPVFAVTIAPSPQAPDVAGRSVYAFAGIGRPEKFRRTLEQAGAIVEGWAAFPDHYPYEEEDLRELFASAEERSYPVLTTAKDSVRLPSALRGRVTPFAVEAVFADEEAVMDKIRALIAARRESFA